MFETISPAKKTFLCLPGPLLGREFCTACIRSLSNLALAATYFSYHLCKSHEACITAVVSVPQQCKLPCAGQVFVGCKFSNAINKGGCRNFTAGSVVPVEANTLHSAENPSCTPIRAFQAFTGQVSTYSCLHPNWN